MRVFSSIVLTALASTALSSQALAGSILQPAGASTDMGNFPTYGPTNAINQSGLSDSYVSGVTDFDSFVASTHTVGGGNSHNAWFAESGVTTGVFDFDLGGTFEIESFAFWADPQGIGQSVNSFTLLADDNADFSSPVILGTFNAADGPGGQNSDETNFGQAFGFTPTSASYVRMEIHSNHGSDSTTGISEAAFELIPAPASLSLFGAALLGLSRRRRA